ncbi:hypothetical protein CEXT_236351 [Caerostris extrusa]|uniref:Uncharacterized protein n=1 Tax=Caerostris extrusa TaxID=172846 RepID=A0AAV4UPH4_CAEEX|nr:hypothetical protein CEXT_236351 [Caerostris extrusa]
MCERRGEWVLLRTTRGTSLLYITCTYQPEINCEGLRRTTALLNKATADISMTIKFWKDLGDNTDTDLDKTMERKINELQNQKKGLEEQRPIKAILKGLPQQFTTTEIEEELKALNFTVDKPFPISDTNQIDTEINNLTTLITTAYNNSSKRSAHNNCHFLPPHFKQLITQRNQARKAWQLFRDPPSKDFLQPNSSSSKKTF